MQKKISFIGSGKVATGLALAFDRAGYTIHQIISRNKEHAFSLAKKFGSYHSDSLYDVFPDIDFLVIAVSDDEIAKVASVVRLTNITVIHTSGAVPMEVLRDTSGSYGVLYPLQSFSGAAVDLRQVPVLIEGSDEGTEKKLDALAYEISNRVVMMDSANRQKIHLAAVMVNNFANFMYILADKYLKDNGLSFDLLLPLIRETVARLEKMSPLEAQTGPARRGDHATINRHLEMLGSDPEMARLYALVSKMIEEVYGRE